MPTRRTATTVAALVGAAGLAACGAATQTIEVTGAPAGPVPTPAAVVPVKANKLTIAATEFAFAPSAIVAKPGRFTVTFANRGTMPHELVALRTAKTAPGALAVVSKGRVSEERSVGKVALTAAGSSRTQTFDLHRGRYLFVCNVPGHYSSGMQGTLVVK